MESTPTPTPPEPTRRDFARAVAVAAAAAVAAPARADDPPKPDKPPTVGQALADAARARYGKHLSDEQLAAVQRSIAGNLQVADRLARFPLKNGDEPAVVFRADLP